MDRHRPILEQRIQTPAVWNSNDFLADRQYFKWAQREGNQGEEEGLHHHDGGRDVWHHVPEFFPVEEDGEGGVGGKNPGPQKE